MNKNILRTAVQFLGCTILVFIIRSRELDMVPHVFALVVLLVIYFIVFDTVWKKETKDEKKNKKR